MFSKMVALAACAFLVDAFNYDRCDKVNGPFAWPGHCQGTQQSPVNVCGAQLITKSSYTSSSDGKKYDNYVISAYKYNIKTPLTMQNLGQTMMYTCQGMTNANAPFLQIPNLHYLVGDRAPAGSLRNPIWRFAQVHIHFGRSGNANEGSEHTVFGERRAAEFHMVHFNTALGADMPSAVATGRKDALLIIAVHLVIGTEDTPFLQTIAAYAKNLPPPPTNTAVNSAGSVALSDIFDAKDDYFAYAGSMTQPVLNPGCNQQATFLVMKTPKTITPQNLALLKLARLSSTQLLAQLGNFRPLYALNGRVIYTTCTKSAGIPCQTIPVPDPFCPCTGPAILLNAPTDAVTGEKTETCTTSTPTWVWIVIGVAVPMAMILTVVVTLYFTSWRHTHPTEKIVMAYTPCQEMAPGSVPNSVVTVNELVH